MPGGDGTGPAGMGPMTGRAAGFCAGYDVPGYMNPIFGRGFWGRGFGWGGRGWRNRFYATGLTGWQRAGLGWGTYAPFHPSAPGFAAPFTATREQEIEALRSQAEYFENTLEEIRKRISEMEAKAEET